MKIPLKPLLITATITFVFTALGYILFGDSIYLTTVSFFAASVANATAVGGGFLFMPLFIYVYNLPALVALKLSLATQAFGMTSGAIGWGRHYIDTQAFIIGSAASICGVWLASFVWVVSAEQIKLLFALTSLAVFFALIVEVKFVDSGSEQAANFNLSLSTVFFIAAAFVGGLVTGWTAIGVGEVIALYLLFIYRLKIEVAIATGVAVLAASSVAGLVFHSNLGGIPWELLLFTIPGVLVGGRAGAKIAKALESNQEPDADKQKNTMSPLKRVFAAVILLNCLAIFLSEIGSQGSY
ncbi:MAG: sulfite exporter TauE/SafE family protein [Porticoccaceae bacterium]|nr:sulfite exporter TauE/SafE family protein [Porticoccaceae bacterium]